MKGQTKGLGLGRTPAMAKPKPKAQRDVDNRIKGDSRPGKKGMC